MENQDLQAYLDEKDDSSEVATLTELGEDGHAMEIVEKENSDADEEQDADGTYFVDQDGNYFFEPKKYSLENVKEEKTDEETDLDVKPSTTTTEKKRPKIENELLSSPRKRTTRKSAITAASATATKDSNEYSFFITDPDDPQSVQVYDFQEEQSLDNNNVEHDDLAVTKNVMHVNSNTKSTVGSSAKEKNNGVHSCMHCSYTTNKKHLLANHFKGHSDERPFSCSVCERAFRTNASLLNHVNTHLGNKPHSCKYCESRFTTSGELVRHVRYKHTKEKPHKCSECDYSSVELSKLRRHMRCHTGERPYQCPHCTYASPDSFKLKRHMRTHTGEKPYECDICHSRFTQSNSLKSHRLIHNVGVKPVFQCEFCPTTCGRKTDLRLHVQKLHHSDQPIVCKRCGKELPDRYTYKVHLKTHEGEKCFRCKICPYASISMRHLETHMLIHTDQKPFVCEVCHMTFRQLQLLKRHHNVYHDSEYVPPTPRAKLHQCPHCSRSFTHKGNLMRHMEMHDPSSNIETSKLELKIGRMARLKNDGSITIVNSEKASSDQEENTVELINEPSQDEVPDSYYEIIETFDEDKTNEDVAERKPTLSNTRNIQVKNSVSVTEHTSSEYVPEIKSVSIKKESNGKEFMSVEVGDGQQYMLVEVIQCEDEEDDEENCITVENTEADNLQISLTQETTKDSVNNCFGFEEDEDCSAVGGGSDGRMQLLHLIP